MSAALEASGISSVNRALVVTSITGLFIDLTIVLISAVNAQVTGGTNNTSTSNSPVSQEERQQYLDELQSESTRMLTPALVFLAVVALCGIVGNTLVIVVYTRKDQWTATGVFIITIAVHDLVANIIAIPGDIYDLLHSWDFESKIVCSGLTYMAVFTTISAAFIMVAVAVTRYRKICRPYEWQITTRNAEVISIMACSLSALFSIPYIIVMGRQTIKTPRSDIVGYECATKDDYVGTIFPLVLYLFYLFLYIACSGSLTVLYILIGVKVYKHRRTHGLTLFMSRLSEPPGTTSRYNSSLKEEPLNQNECNCRSCKSPYNKKIVTSFTGEIAIQSARNVDEIKIKRFLVGKEANEVPVQNNLRIFTDRIEVRTPLVDELFVNLHKAKSAKAYPASHENCHYNNTDDWPNIVKDNSCGEDARTSVIRMMGRKNANIKIRTIKYHCGDIVSIWKYTERYVDEFLNTENKLGAAKTKDVTVTVFHLKIVDRITRHSTETAANNIMTESDPSSTFQWFEVIYCPDGEHTTFNSHFVQQDTFRLPLNNSRLQQTEWLRASAIKSLEIPDDMLEHKSVISGQWRGSCVDVISSLPSSGQFNDSDIPVTNNVQINTNLLGRRLREMMLRRGSLLSITYQQNTTFTLPVSRTTVMLFIISAFFIFGYLPHLAIKITLFLSPSVFQNMSMTGQSVLCVLLRSYFLNSAVNPIVYSLCDSNFRLECYKVLKCSSKN